MACSSASQLKKKTANLIGFAAPVLLVLLSKLLDRVLRARHEPSPKLTKAQEQDQAQEQQRERTHVDAVISVSGGVCQDHRKNPVRRRSRSPRGPGTAAAVPKSSHCRHRSSAIRSGTRSLQ